MSSKRRSIMGCQFNLRNAQGLDFDLWSRLNISELLKLQTEEFFLSDFLAQKQRKVSKSRFCCQTLWRIT